MKHVQRGELQSWTLIFAQMRNVAKKCFSANVPKVLIFGLLQPWTKINDKTAKICGKIAFPRYTEIRKVLNLGLKAKKTLQNETIPRTGHYVAIHVIMVT